MVKGILEQMVTECEHLEWAGSVVVRFDEERPTGLRCLTLKLSPGI